jgi:hypothetical protein
MGCSGPRSRPPNVRPTQIKEALIQWLAENPEDMEFKAFGVVASVLEEKWPCPKG